MSSSQPSLFIADQRVYRLNLNGDLRGQAKHLFSTSQLHNPDADFRKMTTEIAGETEIDSKKNGGRRWLPIADRFAALASLDARLIAVTVSGGIGKSILVDQLQVVRAAENPGHVVVRLHISELPESGKQIAGDNDTVDDSNDPVLVSHLRNWFRKQQHCAPLPRAGKTQSQDQLTRWVQQRIRSGWFTLIVDGLDECPVADGEIRLQALRQFLDSYPRCYCVVAGRPYAITDGSYWKAIFADDDTTGRDANGSLWDFWLVDSFTTEQRDRYLGPEISQQLKLVGADIEFTPRLLEQVLAIGAEKMQSVRSAADIYWQAIEQGINKSEFKDGILAKHPFDADEIIDIFSAIAIELVMRESKEKSTHGVPDADPTIVIKGKGLVKSLFKKIQNRLATIDVSLDDHRWKQFRRLGTSLIEFNFLKDHSTGIVRWWNPTERDFFAALWIVRSSNAADRNWFADRQSSVLGYATPASRHDRLNDVWKFICEMPTEAMIDRDEGNGQTGRWLHCLAPLFQRPELHSRSNELIYRSWPRLLQQADRLGTQWTEHQLEDATARLQRDVQTEFANNADANLGGRDFCQDLPADNSPPSTISAESILYRFLFQYLEIRQHPDTKSTCDQDLENAMCDVGAEPGKSFRCGHPKQYRNAPQDHQLRRRFDICAYQTTNRLFDLFDPHHRQRFDDYGYQRWSPHDRGPAIYINHYDAWVAAAWFHGCLPDEWEWEFVVRSGPPTDSRQPLWHFGDDKNHLTQYAWYNKSAYPDSKLQAMEVGQLKPLMIGDQAIYDMHGNVWERCQNRFSADVVFRSCRGGSFSSVANLTRCSYRGSSAPSDASNGIGFRVARAKSGKS